MRKSKEFSQSLKEGLKFAQGKKAKVKVERLLVKRKPSKLKK
jgi:hypothetical protein